MRRMIPTLADPSDRPAFISSCDSYLEARTGKYEWRRVRYKAALKAIQWPQGGMMVGSIPPGAVQGLSDDDTVFDIGAGWTEFDYCLRVDGASRCRYIPIDGCIDGVDLETWTPLRTAEWFVALELVEHLDNPERLIRTMQDAATKGVVLSTPNPETTDVLGMDPTHKTEIHRELLFSLGFNVYRKNFYGGTDDSLFAVWYADGSSYNDEWAQLTS